MPGTRNCVPPARSADRGTPSPGGVDRFYAIVLARRVRNVAVWSIAFFVASVPVAMVSGGIGGEGADAAGAGAALAMLCWLVGFAAGLWSFVLAFRHWDALPSATRWLASLPLIVVLFLLALAMLATAIGVRA